MKHKTATITFHASHNYGSMLQAYALQQTLYKLGHDNDIINLRTDRQKRLYWPMCDIPFDSFKSFVKKLLIAPYQKSLWKKYRLFEAFLQKDLRLTQEYKTLEEVEKANLCYDCYISGGDQIWNTAPDDFDWSFYLPFVKQGKRISYAVSMGPKASEQVTERERVRSCLLKYDHISVREEGTEDLVSFLIDRKVPITLDPALLLTGADWSRQIASKPIVKGDYILVYSPAYKPEVYDMAKNISKFLKMKVVVTTFSFHNFQYGFKQQLATGPWEFLNLAQNARLVVSGSFHALVFATLFHVPFFAVDGDQDNRMITFLKNMNLLDRTINEKDYKTKRSTAFQIDFKDADQFLTLKRKENLAYLKNAIEN